MSIVSLSVLSTTRPTWPSQLPRRLLALMKKSAHETVPQFFIHSSRPEFDQFFIAFPPPPLTPTQLFPFSLSANALVSSLAMHCAFQLQYLTITLRIFITLLRMQGQL